MFLLWEEPRLQGAAGDSAVTGHTGHVQVGRRGAAGMGKEGAVCVHAVSVSLCAYTQVCPCVHSGERKPAADLQEEGQGQRRLPL